MEGMKDRRNEGWKKWRIEGMEDRRNEGWKE